MLWKRRKEKTQLFQDIQKAWGNNWHYVFTYSVNCNFFKTWNVKQIIHKNYATPATFGG
jgi:hypothetical protein